MEVLLLGGIIILEGLVAFLLMVLMVLVVLEGLVALLLLLVVLVASEVYIKI